jgi:hypothetical protein
VRRGCRQTSLQPEHMPCQQRGGASAASSQCTKETRVHNARTVLLLLLPDQTDSRQTDRQKDRKTYRDREADIRSHLRATITR